MTTPNKNVCRGYIQGMAVTANKCIECVFPNISFHYDVTYIIW